MAHGAGRASTVGTWHNGSSGHEVDITHASTLRFLKKAKLKLQGTMASEFAASPQSWDQQHPLKV